MAAKRESEGPISNIRSSSQVKLKKLEIIEMTQSVKLSKGPKIQKSNVGAEGLNLRVEDIILEEDLGENFEHEMEE